MHLCTNHPEFLPSMYPTKIERESLNTKWEFLAHFIFKSIVNFGVLFRKRETGNPNLGSLKLDGEESL